MELPQCQASSQDSVPGYNRLCHVVSTHCRRHCLNLVIVNSCQNVPEVRNFLDCFKELTLFVNYSAKRKHIMTTNMSEKIVDDLTKDLEAEKHKEEHFQSASRRQVLPTLSDTRWLSRVDSISTLLVKFEQIYLSMEIIAEKSSGQSKHDATSFVKKMDEFPFIATAVISVCPCLHSTSVCGPSVKDL